MVNIPLPFKPKAKTPLPKLGLRLPCSHELREVKSHLTPKSRAEHLPHIGAGGAEQTCGCARSQAECSFDHSCRRRMVAL